MARSFSMASFGSSSSLPTILLAALLASTLGLAGCDSGTQEPDAPAAEAVDYAPTNGSSGGDSTSSGSATIPTDTEIAPERFPTELPKGTERAIPANFPSDVPIYPGAEPALGAGRTVGTSERAGVRLLSNDDAATVTDYYESQLREGGWEIAEGEQNAVGKLISATSGGKAVSILIIESPAGGTDIIQLVEQD